VFPVKSNASALHFPIFRGVNLIQCISPAIGLMKTILCSLYSAFDALYTARHPV
jgi:hypothetical protein